MIRLLRSTSVRLALGYAALFIVSSLALVGFIGWGTAGYLDREVEAAIVADTRAVADRLRDFGLAGAVATVTERVVQTADEHAIYLLANPALAPVAGNLDAWPAAVKREPGWYQAELVQANKLHATRLLHVALPGNYHLLVGRDVQDRVAVQSLILNALAWAAAAAIAIAVAGGLLVRRAVLRRVEAINRTAVAIVQGDLSQRVPVRGTSDEFDQLAQTINTMLQQIGVLIESVRNASNAVAHDLRTPLAELRARLEELLRVKPSPDATFGEIQGAVADIDRIIGIFNALLRLAEIDSGERRAGFRSVDIAALAAEAAELYAPLIEERGAKLAIDAPGGMAVTGDPFLLAQAIGNLLDNAAKYAPAGSTISLDVARRADQQIEITVADRGPGIPDTEKGRVTERFYRGDASRSTVGVGLGLSVVAAVARLHGGALTLGDNHPGLRAALVLPAAAETDVRASTSSAQTDKNTARPEPVEGRA